MGFLIALLTLVMVADCLILILLVLIQLPKKEAGIGQAFGATATDALFGAGSGNVLTKITKYSAGIFFGMAIIISLLYNISRNRNTSTFTSSLNQTPSLPSGPATLPQTAPQVTPPPSNAASATNVIALPPQAEATNTPLLKLPSAAPTTNK